MLKEQRQRQILELLKTKQAVSSAELCSTFAVTHETVRKDLDALARRGLLERTFGGAMAAPAPTSQTPDLPAASRQTENIEAKRAIGRHAATLIAPGDTVVLDSSTTTLELAKCIPENREIVVITNALLVLCELAGKKGVSLISVGGHYRQLSASFLGAVAEANLGQYNVNKAFLSGNAFSPAKGLMDPNEIEPEFKRRMIAAARESILLVDHTKFDRIAPFTVCPATAFGTIVSDAGLADSHLRALKKLGRAVIRCRR